VQSACLLEHRRDRPLFRTPVSPGAYPTSSWASVSDSRSRRSRTLDHPTFLVDWDRCRAPACSNIGKIAHHSGHPFHEALIPHRLVLPSLILPVVGARECSTTSIAWYQCGAPACPNIGKIAHRSRRRLSRVVLFCLAPSCVEAFVHIYPWLCHPALS